MSINSAVLDGVIYTQQQPIWPQQATRKKKKKKVNERYDCIRFKAGPVKVFRFTKFVLIYFVTIIFTDYPGMNMLQINQLFRSKNRKMLTIPMV